MNEIFAAFLSVNVLEFKYENFLCNFAAAVFFGVFAVVCLSVYQQGRMHCTVFISIGNLLLLLLLLC